MPVLLTKDGVDQWLSDDVVAPLHLASGIPDEAVEYFAVSTDVNNARNHGPQLLEPITLVTEITETLF
jgi:putative SOS response-associated peptidase YedK